MADNRTMAQLLEAPTEGYEDAIVVPKITRDNFELKHGLLNLVQNKQFFGHDKEDPHAHIRYFNKITSTMKFPNVRSKAKVRNSRKKPIVAKVSSSTSTPSIFSDVAELKDMVKALLLDKKNQSPAPTPVKAVKESCVTCDANYNQGNTSYRAPIANQIRPPDFPPAQNNQNNQGNNQNCYNQNQGNFNHASAYQPPVHQGQIYRPQEDFQANVKANDVVMRNMQTQGQNMQNLLTNLTDMLSKFVTFNTASTSGTLPSNTVTNPKEDLKGITTRSGVAYKGLETDIHKRTKNKAKIDKTEHEMEKSERQSQIKAASTLSNAFLLIPKAQSSDCIDIPAQPRWEERPGNILILHLGYNDSCF
ncbi:hypothetical protein Tco_1569454 [Tanacetum coccineum]